MISGTSQHISSGTLKNSFDRRGIVIGAVQGGLGLLLAARMAWIGVAQNEKYKLAAESNRVNLTLIPPRRGWVLDRNGAPLASNRADFRVDLIPDRLVDPDRTVDELGKLLNLTAVDIRDLKDKLDKDMAFNRSKWPRGSIGNGSPRSASVCRICPEWCRSGAFHAFTQPGHPWVIWSAMSGLPQLRITKRIATRC